MLSAFRRGVGSARAYLQALRSCGAVVNTAITIVCPQGIVVNKDANLLAFNGGHITLTKYWTPKPYGQRQKLKLLWRTLSP